MLVVPSEELRMIHKLKHHDKRATREYEQQHDNTGFVFFVTVVWQTKCESGYSHGLCPNTCQR